jgi:N-methylhydantoinase A
MAFAIGVDVGGTFTDLVAIDGAGRSLAAKVPSTPEDQSVGVVAGLRRLADDLGLSLAGLLAESETIVHGTTVGTNLMLEEKGAVTGLLTTRGFRDVIDVRRSIKEAAFDIRLPPPFAIVPRRRRLPVSERVDAQGEVVTPLDEADVRRGLERLRAQEVESIAVCYLFSFLNPEHELRTGELLNELAPDLHVSLSHQVIPRMREFERLSTTLVDAFISPAMGRYLRSLERSLADAGFEGDLFVMATDGGMLSVDQAVRHGVQLVLSGPVGGVVAGAEVGRRTGTRNVLTVDMGGTSFDACLIVDGRPAMAGESWINRYKVAVPTLDVRTIGTGGGSIAWIDPGGKLRVGPESAGAVPGPACYGRGGELPTVTDADLLLGLMSPDSFLGGVLPLDADAALRAVDTHVARPAGMEPVEAAEAIVRVAVNDLANALREITQRRGVDPRGFSLVAFGGAGPVHAWQVARELGIDRVLVPRGRAPVLCALGDVLADVRISRSAGIFARTLDLDLDALNRAVGAARAGALEELEAAPGVEPLEPEVMLELHYRQQTHDLTVAAELEDGRLTRRSIDETIERFHALHEQLFTFSKPGHELELTSIRVDATGTRSTPAPDWGPASLERRGVAVGARAVVLPGAGGPVEAMVYDGTLLPDGARIPGPAIIEEADTTVVVPLGGTLATGSGIAYELTLS